MLKSRRIGSIPVDIETCEANEIYLSAKHANLIAEPGIGGIINVLYRSNTQEHLPLSVFVELTSFCNFSCPFCYINAEDYPHSQIPRFEALKETLDFLINAGMIYCTLSGGECLLHPDFSKIYSYLKKSGVLVTVFTNGYLINQEIIDLFKQYKPFKLEISIYGIDNTSYRTATGTEHIDVSHIFDTILSLKKNGINVVCKTPITSLTEDSFPQIEQWCMNHNVQYYTGTDLMDTYGGSSRTDFLSSEKIRAEKREESDLEFFSDRELLKKACGKKNTRKNFDCSAGRTEVMIDSRYRLLPCMKAAGVDAWMFDIKSMGIERAYRCLIEKISAVKNTPLAHCSGCEHHYVCQECFMTQFGISNLQESRQAYCQFLSNFIQEGLINHNINLSEL